MSPRTVRLSHVFESRRPADRRVAFGPDGGHRWGDLLRDAAGLAASIRSAGAGRWLLHTEDSYAAAVALLGLARSGGTAILPPNLQSETLRRLAEDAAGAIVDPGTTGLPARLPQLAPLGAPPAPAPAPADPLDRERPLVEFFTSGTTGDRRRVVKAARHLEDEVETLERVFGDRLSEATRIYATVPHQHIYGLLFRVLWPLAAGRPFQIDTPLQPRELAARMQAEGDCALVTSPVHLKHLTGSRLLEELRATCRVVFSSGGPLDAEVSKRATDQLHRAPLEILGSTETGGIAVRERSVNGESWSPLPGVAVQVEGESERLRVTSPFVSVGEPAQNGHLCFLSGDRARIEPGGTFRVLGRADRTVKIGGKRLSLPDMEHDLEDHGWVTEAALVALDQGSEPRVHAVLVLAAEGRSALDARGRRGVGGELAGHLAARWDRVLLPRAWRIVDALPRNAQGKLPAAALAALFSRQRGPLVESETRGERRLERRIVVPRDLECFEGHFDDFAVVPGAVQLGWALEAARLLLGHNPRLRIVEALKFSAPLLPGDTATLVVEVTPEADRVRFRLYRGEQVFATGRCVVATGREAST